MTHRANCAKKKEEHKAFWLFAFSANRTSASKELPLYSLSGLFLGITLAAVPALAWRIPYSRLYPLLYGPMSYHQAPRFRLRQDLAALNDTFTGQPDMAPCQDPRLVEEFTSLVRQEEPFKAAQTRYSIQITRL